MAKKLTEQEAILEEIQQSLTEEIHSLRPDAIQRAGSILDRDVSVPSLNGIFGGKNNTYVDSVRTRFLDFDDFFAQWIKGLNDTFEEEKEIYLSYNSSMDWDARASFRNVKLLQDPIVRDYAKKLLERNFYKYLEQRVRLKPEENLWSVWFGYKLIYGLLIAPTKRGGQWTNDKSEIRRANFNYWTIGHVLATGFIDPNLDTPHKFSDINQFYIFYQSVLKRLSSSQYEQTISDKYIDYLKASTDVLNEPFLIPEFRYAGLADKHEYRLDFTILNQHTEEFIGFEISPASSHMSISNLKQKQSEVNIELKQKWEKEMAKRNSYFKTFEITTITFTDSALTDMDLCFKTMSEKLSARPRTKASLTDQLNRLKSF